MTTSVETHTRQAWTLMKSILAGFSGSTETAPAADLEEAVQALEERALERQARLEAALIQVANSILYRIGQTRTTFPDE